MPYEYKHEALASESFYFECTHSLALRACITHLFTYVVSIPKEKETRNSNTCASGYYNPRSVVSEMLARRVEVTEEDSNLRKNASIYFLTLS